MKDRKIRQRHKKTDSFTQNNLMKFIQSYYDPRPLLLLLLLSFILLNTQRMNVTSLIFLSLKIPMQS